MKISAKDGKPCQNWKVRVAALPEPHLSVYFSAHLSTEHFKKAGGFFLPKGNGCAVAAVCKKRKSRVSPFRRRANLLRMTPFKRSVYSADDCSLLPAKASLAAFNEERLFYKWKRPSVSLRRSRKLFNTPGRYFVKSPHCLEKNFVFKENLQRKIFLVLLILPLPLLFSEFLSSRLLPFSSNARLLPTLLSFFRAPERSLFPYLFFKALLPSRRPRLPGADLLSCRYLCILVVPVFLSPRLPPSLLSRPLFFLVAALVFSPRKIYFFFYRVKDKKRNPQRSFLPARRRKVFRVSACAAVCSPKNPAYPPQKGFVPILPSYRRAYTF